MPYDIRQNYRGKSGYSVVGPDGTIRGTHPSRREAIEQQRALYAAESRSKKISKMEDLYEQLSEPEKEFHNSLVSLAEKYGPLDNENTGIWIGYEPPAQNKEASIGVMCGNCSLHYDKEEGGIACKIVSLQIQEKGKCRLAAIPPGYVNVKKNLWGGRFINNGGSL